MRKLLLLSAALVALLSLVTIAQGSAPDSAHIWFFGDCENPYDSPDSITADSGGGYFLGGGCRGIGVFVGDWDNEGIAGEVSYEAMEEFGGYWEVDYLKAINIFGGSPVPGTEYGCQVVDEESVTPQTFGGGLWIAIFSVVPCEPTILAVAYTDVIDDGGGYDPAVDLLIAKILDADGGGTVTVGDMVVTATYPRDTGAASTGQFSVTMHPVTTIWAYEPQFVAVSSDGTNVFVFGRSSTQEAYSEGPDGEGDYTGFSDHFTDIGDGVQTDPSSPSVPPETIPPSDVSSAGDDPFIDVELRYPDPILVVAYTDMNDSDGGYDPEVDVLIGKLVDFDGSGGVSVGDKVILSMYPKGFDFGTAGFGTFTVTEHTVYSVTYLNALTVSVWTTSTLAIGTTFYFSAAPVYQQFINLDSPGFAFIDQTLGTNDSVEVDSGGASSPSDAVPTSTAVNATDDAFLDVQVNYTLPLP